MEFKHKLNKYEIEILKFFDTVLSETKYYFEIQEKCICSCCGNEHFMIKYCSDEDDLYFDNQVLAIEAAKNYIIEKY